MTTDETIETEWHNNEHGLRSCWILMKTAGMTDDNWWKLLEQLITTDEPWWRNWWNMMTPNDAFDENW